jgi:hypothetical protein
MGFPWSDGIEVTFRIRLSQSRCIHDDGSASEGLGISALVKEFGPPAELNQLLSQAAKAGREGIQLLVQFQ